MTHSPTPDPASWSDLARKKSVTPEIAALLMDVSVEEAERQLEMARPGPMAGAPRGYGQSSSGRRMGARG